MIENPKNRVFQKALVCPKIVGSSSKAPRSKLLECAVNLTYWASRQRADRPPQRSPKVCSFWRTTLYNSKGAKTVCTMQKWIQTHSIFFAGTTQSFPSEQMNPLHYSFRRRRLMVFHTTQKPTTKEKISIKDVMNN